MSFARTEKQKRSGSLWWKKPGLPEFLLVTESEEDEAEAYLLKDLSEDGEAEARYVFVEDDEELEAVSKIFAELLDDVDLEL